MSDLTTNMESRLDGDDLDRTRTAIYQQMAESIRIAHDINPNSWSVQLYEGRVIVFVSEYTAWLYQRNRSERLEVLLKAPAPSLPSITGVKDDFRRNESLGMDLVRVSVPYGEFERLWPDIGESHRQIVEALARSVKSRSSRAASFDPTALKEIEERSGTALPFPAYAVNADRPSGVVPEMPSDVAERFAMSILRAHQVNDRSWSVYLRSDEPILSVSFNNALGWIPRQQRIELGVVLDLVPEDVRVRWTGHLPDDRFLNGEAGWYWAEGDDIEALFVDLAEAHEAAVDRLAREVRDRAHRATSFDPSLLHEIAISSATDLMSPGYADELKERTEASQSLSVARRLSTVEPLASVRRSVSRQGLTYSDRQLATFYAALQTKGFVILSGISGTGKSKLAQAFVRCLPAWATDEPNVIEGEGLIRVAIKPYMLKHNRLYLPSRQIRRFGIPDIGETRQVRLNFDGTQAVGSLRHIKDMSAGSPLVYLSLTKVLAPQIQEVGLGGYLYIEPESNDEADVVGFDIRSPGVLADRLEESEAEALPIKSPVPNNLFLSVRPDWRDSRALLGYHNPLLGAYEWTEFLRFILRASANFRGPADERVAWFVILDEMNLAQVEYYFADLLSVLESGRDAEGWTREAIRIERPEPSEDQDDAEVPPASVHLPPNLYIIGTVNMDETTHAFSPKVLDRAFTIELSEVDFSHYPPVVAPGAVDLSDEERQALLAEFSRGGKFVGIDKAEVAAVLDDHPAIRDWLSVLNRELARSRFQFGYRVFDEIATFVGAYRALLPDATLEETFDLAVLMKVLPKFSGSASRLERPLLDVLAWCVDPLRLPQREIMERANGSDGKDWRDRDLTGLGDMTFPVTAQQVMRMLDTLAADGFASFG